MSKNKEIQRKRMMSYFIKAAEEIINNEGIEAVTIRKVASIAAYNSATIYNYFDDIDHLILYTMVKYLQAYTLSLAEAIGNTQDPRKIMEESWRAFCHHAFSHPKVFYKLFFDKDSYKLETVLKDYYDIFPEHIEKFPPGVAKILKEYDITKRCYMALAEVVSPDKCSESFLSLPNTIIVLSLQGLLYRTAEGMVDESPEELTEKFIDIVHYIVGRI